MASRRGGQDSGARWRWLRAVGAAVWLPALVVGPSAVGSTTIADEAPAGLSVSLDTDRTSYRPGQPVHFTLTLTNRAAKPARLVFRSGQRFDLTIQDKTGAVVWRWAEGKVFTMALAEETVGPGESRAYSAAFTGTLASGLYWVRGDIVAEGGPLTDRTIVTVK